MWALHPQPPLPRALPARRPELMELVEPRLNATKNTQSLCLREARECDEKRIPNLRKQNCSEIRTVCAKKVSDVPHVMRTKVSAVLLFANEELQKTLPSQKDRNCIAATISRRQRQMQLAIHFRLTATGSRAQFRVGCTLVRTFEFTRSAVDFRSDSYKACTPR